MTSPALPDTDEAEARDRQCDNSTTSTSGAVGVSGAELQVMPGKLRAPKPSTGKWTEQVRAEEEAKQQEPDALNRQHQQQRQNFEKGRSSVEEEAQPCSQRNSSELWVAVRGAPSVHLGKANEAPAAEPRETTAGAATEPTTNVPVGEAAPAEEEKGNEGTEEASTSPRGSIDEDTFVTVDREDVIDAVADYVKGRIKSHDLFDSAMPRDVAKAVDTAIADEVQGGWKRVWGRGRLLFRSSEALTKGSKSLAAELGPAGRTGQALRCVSQKAIQGSSKALAAIRSAAADGSGGSGPPQD